MTKAGTRERKSSNRRGDSPNLVDTVVDQLRQLILKGEFGDTGEMPSEGDLGTQFGVSRTVTREAMRILRTQGLVDVSRGKMPRVRPVDPMVAVESLQNHLHRSSASLAQLIEIRHALEPAIASLAAERATLADIEKMRELILAQEKAAGLNDQIEADIQFHNKLALATRNPIFPLLLSTVLPLMFESRRRTISKVGVARALIGHRAILEAVHHRDAKGARAAMEMHLGMAVEDLNRFGT